MLNAQLPYKEGQTARVRGAEGVLGLSQLMLPQHAHAATATSHNKSRVSFKYAANK